MHEPENDAPAPVDSPGDADEGCTADGWEFGNGGGGDPGTEGSAQADDRRNTAAAPPGAQEVSEPTKRDADAAVTDGKGTIFERMCYDGERVVGGAPVANGGVAVTSHRVLVHAPDAEPPFQTVHRPNIAGVGVNTTGKAVDAARALRVGIYAVVLLAAGFFVDLGGLVQPVQAPPGTGIGSVLTLVNSMIAAVGYVDEALTVLGLFALAVSLLFLSVYLRGRTRALEIEVEGGDPLRIPTDSGETAAERLRTLLDNSG